MATREKIAAQELVFTAVYEPAEEGGFVVTFPAIPNLATQGETLEEARGMAADCLQGYLESLRELSRPLPEVRSTDPRSYATRSESG